MEWNYLQIPFSIYSEFRNSDDEQETGLFEQLSLPKVTKRKRYVSQLSN